MADQEVSMWKKLDRSYEWKQSPTDEKHFRLLVHYATQTLAALVGVVAGLLGLQGFTVFLTFFGLTYFGADHFKARILRVPDDFFSGPVDPEDIQAQNKRVSEVMEAIQGSLPIFVLIC
jgi:hypothetical protein